MTHTEFLAIVTPIKDKMFRFARQLLISREEAEDATQEMLLKLWKNKTKIKEYKNLEAFSMTMTKNFCLDKLKSKHTQNLKIVHNNYQDNEALLQKKIELNDSVYWVTKIINTLPKQQQMIVQLRDVEHYSFEEIAVMLGMNETAIRVALSRARKAIRNTLVKTHNYGLS